jgi:hypothetical protein
MSDRDERQAAAEPRSEQSEGGRPEAPSGPSSAWQGYDLETLNAVLDG